MSAASRLSAVLLVLGPVLQAGEPSLAERANAILTQHCHQCHGLAGSSKGGLSAILDRDAHEGDAAARQPSQRASAPALIGHTATSHDPTKWRNRSPGRRPQRSLSQCQQTATATHFGMNRANYCVP